jgi:hypothetical protein
MEYYYKGKRVDSPEKADKAVLNKPGTVKPIVQELMEQIYELKQSLDKINKTFDAYKPELRELVMNEFTELKQEIKMVLVLENSIALELKKGANKESFKYKEALPEILSLIEKENPKLKEAIQVIIQKNTSISKAEPALSIVRGDIDENKNYNTNQQERVYNFIKDGSVLRKYVSNMIEKLEDIKVEITK